MSRLPEKLNGNKTPKRRTPLWPNLGNSRPRPSSDVYQPYLPTNPSRHATLPFRITFSSTFTNLTLIFPRCSQHVQLLPCDDEIYIADLESPVGCEGRWAAESRLSGSFCGTGDGGTEDEEYQAACDEVISVLIELASPF